VDAFASSLLGELIRPGDRGYEPARQIWNGMIDTGNLSTCPS
jgi:hypothetical protein